MIDGRNSNCPSVDVDDNYHLLQSYYLSIVTLYSISISHCTKALFSQNCIVTISKTKGTIQQKAQF